VPNPQYNSPLFCCDPQLKIALSLAGGVHSLYIEVPEDCEILTANFWFKR